MTDPSAPPETAAETTTETDMTADPIAQHQELVAARLRATRRILGGGGPPVPSGLRCTCDWAGLEGEPHKPFCEKEYGPHAECGVRHEVLEAENADLRAELDRLRAEVVETVEHRVVGTGPSGFQHESHVTLRADYDDWSERPDWTGVRFESRTVRTWTSGWRPVPDDTDGER